MIRAVNHWRGWLYRQPPGGTPAATGLPGNHHRQPVHRTAGEHPASRKQANYRYAVEDIRNIHVIDRLVSECDIIFHLAAVVGVRNIVDHPINTIEVNIGGTEVILQTAARYRRRLMLASTSEVYGKGVTFPFREDDDTLSGPTLRSRWSYAASKAVDEFLAFAYQAELGLPVTLFRLFNTVGPRQVGQYGMVVPRFARWALANEPIQVYGDGAQQRCFGNVYDVVARHPAVGRMRRHNRRALQHRQHGKRSAYCSWRSASATARTAPPRSSWCRMNRPYQQPGFEDFRRRVPSIDKIRAAVGWQPTTPLDETIDQILAYFQQQMR